MRKAILRKMMSGIKLASFSVALASAFLCGNEVQCAVIEVADEELAKDAELANSFRAAFDVGNKDGAPVDVILVSKYTCTNQADSSMFRLDETALAFACLAVNLGAKREEVRGKLDQFINSLEYSLELRHVTGFLNGVPLEGRSDSNKKILEKFDSYCAQLPPVDLQEDSWKIVVLENGIHKRTFTKAEVDKMREVFFEFVSPERVVVYFLTAYRSEAEIDQTALNYTCSVIDTDLQRELGTGPGRFDFNVPDRESTAGDVRNRMLIKAYKEYLESLSNARGAKNTIFYGSVVWYNNKQLCHYDCPFYFRWFDQFFVDSLLGHVLDDAWVFYLGTGKCVADLSGSKLSNAIIDNISVGIGDNFHCREKSWSNSEQQSKLYIHHASVGLYSNDDNGFPSDILTASAAINGVPSRSIGEQRHLSGVFLGNDIFPCVEYGFTHGGSRYNIIIVKDIFGRKIARTN